MDAGPAAVVAAVLVAATAALNPKWLDAAQQRGTLSELDRLLVSNLWVYLAYALARGPVVRVPGQLSRTGTPT